MISVTLSKQLQDNIMTKHRIYVTMHNKTVSAYDASNNIIELDHAKRISARLSHSTIMHQHMPRPYDTNCVEGNEPFSSARNCHEACYSQLFQQKYHSMPSDSPVFLSHSTLKLNSIMSVPDDASVRLMKQKCESACGSDCRQTFYFLKIANQTFGVDDWSFTFSRPHQLVTRIVYSAKTYFADFLMVILNGASFWFTFCPTTFFLSRRFLPPLLPPQPNNGLRSSKVQNRRKL